MAQPSISMKKIIAAVAAALSLGLACAVSAPARAQNVMQNGAADPAVTAAVQEMFEAMHYRALMTRGLQQMAQSLEKNLRASAEFAIKTNSNMDAAAKEKAQAKMEASLVDKIEGLKKFLDDPTLADEILELTVPLYAREYTLAEIGQIAAFYRTPVGAKMVSLSPKLAVDAMQISQQVMARRVGPVLQQLQQNREK
jgi:hypothetical protein